MGLTAKLMCNVIFILFILMCYLTFKNYPSNLLHMKQSKAGHTMMHTINLTDPHSEQDKINIWIIFTKATLNGGLTTKFRNLLQSIYIQNDGTPLHFNILSDTASKFIAKTTFDILNKYYNKSQSKVLVTFYDFKRNAEKIEDIIQVMTPHFSSQPGTYYSDALFYISLGLHRLAPLEQKLAIILDCDLLFKDSIHQLFKEFDKFSPSNLFGLAHELSVVYRHVLFDYRLKHNGTLIGSEPIRKNMKTSQQNIIKDGINKKINRSDMEDVINENLNVSDIGYPGFNSGVLLLNLERIRKSSLFNSLLSKESVENLTEKYLFKGHLGDQDFYTLLGFEYPDLISPLDCGWNRQLCKWWRRSGDESLFDNYYRCDSSIHIYHGNCNTHIPTK